MKKMFAKEMKKEFAWISMGDTGVRVTGARHVGHFFVSSSSPEFSLLTPVLLNIN